MEQTVSLYKSISFNSSLRGVELSYCGKARVESEELERQVSDAYEKGQEEASVALNEQILMQRREVQQLLEQTLTQLDQKIDTCLKQIVQEVPDLVTNIARRVLAEVDIDGAVIKGIVDDVMSDLPNSKDLVEVYLCENDFEKFTSYLDNFESEYPHCEFKVDASLSKADCRVMSRFGEIDARVGTKLRHIKDQLEG